MDGHTAAPKRKADCDETPILDTRKKMKITYVVSSPPTDTAPADESFAQEQPRNPRKRTSSEREDEDGTSDTEQPRQKSTRIQEPDSNDDDLWGENLGETEFKEIFETAAEKRIRLELPGLREIVTRLTHNFATLANKYCSLPLGLRRNVRRPEMQAHLRAAALFQHCLADSNTTPLAMNETCPADKEWYYDLEQAKAALEKPMSAEEELEKVMENLKKAEAAYQSAAVTLSTMQVDSPGLKSVPEGGMILAWNKMCHELHKGVGFDEALQAARNLLDALNEMEYSFPSARSGKRTFFDMDTSTLAPKPHPQVRPQTTAKAQTSKPAPKHRSSSFYNTAPSADKPKATSSSDAAAGPRSTKETLGAEHGSQTYEEGHSCSSEQKTQGADSKNATKEGASSTTPQSDNKSTSHQSSSESSSTGRKSTPAPGCYGQPGGTRSTEQTSTSDSRRTSEQANEQHTPLGSSNPYQAHVEEDTTDDPPTGTAGPSRPYANNHEQEDTHTNASDVPPEPRPSRPYANSHQQEEPYLDPSDAPPESRRSTPYAQYHDNGFSKTNLNDQGTSSFGSGSKFGSGPKFGSDGPKNQKPKPQYFKSSYGSGGGCTWDGFSWDGQPHPFADRVLPPPKYKSHTGGTPFGARKNPFMQPLHTPQPQTERRRPLREWHEQTNKLNATSRAALRFDNFPKPPVQRHSCNTTSSCTSDRQKIGLCTCQLRKAFQWMDQAQLKGEKKKWHPDRFPEAVKQMAHVISTVVSQVWYDKYPNPVQMEA